MINKSIQKSFMLTIKLLFASKSMVEWISSNFILLTIQIQISIRILDK